MGDGEEAACQEALWYVAIYWVTIICFAEEFTLFCYS